MQDYLFWILGAAFGYFCGSISSAVIVCRIVGLPDPRSTGSKNPGATNVLRISEKIGKGKLPAALTLVGDLLKGLLPVALLHIFLPSHLQNVWIAAGLGAFLGHLYPVFFGFQGGKGVATAFGVLIAWNPIVAFVAGGTWGAVFYESRISSLAALTAAFIAPFAAIFFTSGAKMPLAILAMVAILVFRHKANIKRLIRGEEDSFGKKKPRNDFAEDDED